jgi:hypothetical protein
VSGAKCTFTLGILAWPVLGRSRARPDYRPRGGSRPAPNMLKKRGMGTVSMVVAILAVVNSDEDD